MDKSVISTGKAPGAIGPYSQGVIAGDFVFTSGQLGMNPETGNLEEGIEGQTERACRNIAALLEAAGIGFENVVKTTCFLANMEDFATFNSVYEKYFISKPARSCVAVKTLPKNALCEIETISVK